MTHCPRCATEWRAVETRCACGYDAQAVQALEESRARWIVRRQRARGIALGVVVLANLARLVGWETLQLVPGLIAFGAVFFIGWAILCRRRVDRQLREARMPSPLPEARLV